MLRWAASLDAHPDRVLEACNQLHLLGLPFFPGRLFLGLLLFGRSGFGLGGGFAVGGSGRFLTGIRRSGSGSRGRRLADDGELVVLGKVVVVKNLRLRLRGIGIFVDLAGIVAERRLTRRHRILCSR